MRVCTLASGERYYPVWAEKLWQVSPRSVTSHPVSTNSAQTLTQKKKSSEAVVIMHVQHLNATLLQIKTTCSPGVCKNSSLYLFSFIVTVCHRLIPSSAGTFWISSYWLVPSCVLISNPSARSKHLFFLIHAPQHSLLLFLTFNLHRHPIAPSPFLLMHQPKGSVTSSR